MSFSMNALQAHHLHRQASTSPASDKGKTSPAIVRLPSISPSEASSLNSRGFVVVKSAAEIRFLQGFFHTDGAESSEDES